MRQPGENNVKVKKAARRLNKVEALLSGILNGIGTDLVDVREQLEAATEAVKRARSAIDSNQSSSNREVAAKSVPIAPRTGRHVSEGSVTASTASNRKSSQPNSRISPEGLRRIVEANKRRAAERRAAQDAHPTAAQQKSDAGKKTAPAQKGAGKKIPAKRA